MPGMNQKQILKIFKAEQALLSGHFQLSSGLHSAQYLQCALVLQKPWVAQKLGKAIAALVEPLEVQAVIGPALGGVLVAHEVGRALKVRAMFAERAEGQLTLRRGFTLAKGERVLVVEDVVTTGKSTQEVIRIVEESGARVVGVGAIVDRSGGGVPFGVPLHALMAIDVKTYPAESCPLCREGKLPAVKPGSRPRSA